MKIQILGPGCPKCTQLYKNAEKANINLKLGAELEKVENPIEIMKLGVMSTPGLVVNGVVKSTGKLLTSEEIAPLLQ